MFLLAANSLPKYHDLKAVFPLKSIMLFNTMYFPEDLLVYLYRFDSIYVYSTSVPILMPLNYCKLLQQY